MPNYFQAYSANTEGRDFVCGDIHGQWHQLQQALNQVEFDTKRDRLFALGDLVDRGEHSREVFSMLEESWFYSIRGNHEQLLFDAMEKQLPEDIRMWMMNGGDSWVKSVASLQSEVGFLSMVDAYRDNLPWAMEIALADGRRVGLVHAEVPIPDWQHYVTNVQGAGALAAQLRFDSLWSRKIQEVGYESEVAGVDICVHGHCMFQEPVRQFNRCYIDTGAYVTKKSMFGLKRQQIGSLSLLQLESLFDIPQLPLTGIRQKRLARS